MAEAGEESKAGPPPVALLLGHGLAFCFVCPSVYTAIVGCLWVFQASTLAWWSWMFLLFIMPALHLVLSGPTCWISNTLSVRVDAPLLLCSTFLRDVRNLSQYEQKVSGCSMLPGGFRLWGSWFGLPWCKSFDMHPFPGGGFHSTLREEEVTQFVPAPFRFRGSGGFRTHLAEGAPKISVDLAVASSGTGKTSGPARAFIEVQPTTITHYERYGWPVMFPLMPVLAIVWRRWHLRGMEVEMEVIKAQVEQIFKELCSREEGLSGKLTDLWGEDVSVFAADHQARINGQVHHWDSWKYGGPEYVKETLAAALCRPYKMHHPAVQPSAGSLS